MGGWALPPILNANLAEAWQGIDAASSNNEKGHALENLICLLLEAVPGTRIRRNLVDVFRAEEVDVLLYNLKAPNGFHFLSNIILVECKNWTVPVGAKDVDFFCTKVKDRCAEYGILIAANGITGDPMEFSSANQIISSNLSHGIRILVIKLEDLRNIVSTEDFINLIFDKMMDLHGFRTTLV